MGVSARSPQAGRCGDGLAVGADVTRAAALAATEASLPLAGAVPDVACVFVSGADPDQAAEALLIAGRELGARATLGCTVQGVMGAGRAVEGLPAVSVWAASLPGVATRTFHLEVLRSDAALSVVGVPPVTGAEVGLLLPDGWTFPADGFVNRSNVTLDGLPLVGGLAMGNDGAGSTRLLVDDRVVDRGAVGLTLGGLESSGLAAWGMVSQGCRPVGEPMTVTAAEGNVLIELAGSPALERLREVVAGLPDGTRESALTGLQMGIAMNEYAEEHGFGDFLVRGIVGADDVRQALAIGDVVDVGTTVQFHMRDAAAADHDLAAALDGLPGARGTVPSGALLVSCQGRGRGFWGDPAHDLDAAREGLHTKRVAGFFAAGEIGPVGGRNHVHSLSATLLVVGARVAATAGAGVRGA